MQASRDQKTWINKEGNEQLENSVLVNAKTGENCQPIRPQITKKKESKKTSCQCGIF